MFFDFCKNDGAWLFLVAFDGEFAEAEVSGNAGGSSEWLRLNIAIDRAAQKSIFLEFRCFEKFDDRPDFEERKSRLDLKKIGRKILFLAIAISRLNKKPVFENGSIASLHEENLY